MSNHTNQRDSSSSHHNQRRSESPGGSKDQDHTIKSIHAQFLKISFILDIKSIFCSYYKHIMCSLIHLWPTPTPTTLFFFQTLLKTNLETLYQATHYSYGHEFLDYGVDERALVFPHAPISVNFP